MNEQRPKTLREIAAEGIAEMNAARPYVPISDERREKMYADWEAAQAEPDDDDDNEEDEEDDEDA